ncbi:MAG: hypothetical protein HY851_11590 [candidate division Zixibacteria bacterium]|nr:hypothetical protein [candidate division Zixibacteria bacterium]
MHIRLRFFIYAVLLCVPGLTYGRGGMSAGASINACATVAEPVGLIPVGQLSPSSPDSPTTSQFDYLLVSPTRGVTLNVDGLSVDLTGRLTTVSEFLSGLSFTPPPSEASVDRAVVITLIYSDN